MGSKIGARHGLRSCILGCAALAAAVTMGSNAAEARHRHHHHFHFIFLRHTARVHHVRSGGGYSPPTASIVIDGNTGKVLEASNPDALRHPASLTKVMTLYLLFERLRAGKISLDTPLEVSAHAAAQAPTKLGLKPGQTIRVEDAIRAIVTRSANDAAVVIAENLGGSEQAFARAMTQKAHELGMNRTTYVNASGLPDDDQITTARDQVVLARAIEARFPHLYRFFSTRSFVFRGETIRGHNHLLGSMAGVDGIKTGFTTASGFNLLTSLHRDGRYLLGVVLGGRSASRRDAHMRQLLDANFQLASAGRATPILAAAGRSPPESVLPTTALAREPVRARAEARPTAAAYHRLVVGSTAPIRPIAVKTVTYRTVTVQAGKLEPMPVLVPVGSPPQTVEAQAPAAVAEQAIAARSEQGKPAAANPAPASPPRAHNGWMIQIGAFDGEAEARRHLTAAQHKLQSALAAADPFTEAVHKGDTTLYRARFAGLDRATAEAACRQLKRDDFACMALKD
jgi:D-alanyl-D-alanine carboxypeptidase